MVGFGIGPIIGAGIGGFVYERMGPGVLYGAAATLAVAAAVVAWFALNVPALDQPQAGPETTARCRSRRCPTPARPCRRRRVVETEARERVSAAFPQLGGADVAPIGSGWTVDTYDVDGEWIVQFPRERLRRRSPALADPGAARARGGAVGAWCPRRSTRTSRSRRWPTAGSRACRWTRRPTVCGPSGSDGSSTTCT